MGKNISDISGMEKKKRDRLLPKRFNAYDIDVWQYAANEEVGGNLTLWMDLTLNKASKKYRHLVPEPKKKKK